MEKTNFSYETLPVEDSWVEYVRTRLHYSFRHIEEKRRGGRRIRYFKLSDPFLQSDWNLSAIYHNFWRRGMLFYSAGKLLDYYALDQIAQGYRVAEAKNLMNGGFVSPLGLGMKTLAIYNAMQLEQVWAYLRGNNIDRERVLATDVLLGVELCLKSVTIHANWRDTGRFEFDVGHDVVELFEALPDPLRAEILAESEVFAQAYGQFRSEIESTTREAPFLNRSTTLDSGGDRVRKIKEWNDLGRRIRGSNYTAFVNSNDPSVNGGAHGWLLGVLNEMRKTRDEFGDLSQYFRYAPRSNDGDLFLGTAVLNGVLLLGRFLYEHLFPVPPPEKSGPELLSIMPIGGRIFIDLETRMSSPNLLTP